MGILIVEDDAALGLGLEGAFQDEGYEVKLATTGPEGLQMALHEAPDLIVLDVMLPGMSGFEICKKIRDKELQIPIIMLTSKAEENEKVLGFELGADDYVTKPFSVRELLARARVHLRRGSTNNDKMKARDEVVRPQNEQLEFGVARIDFKRHEVYRNGIVQDVTHREFCLLEYFIKHPGEVLSRDKLLDEIWGYDVYPTTRTVDNHILRLRKHIEPNPENPAYIKTVRGVGYLFEIPQDE